MNNGNGHRPLVFRSPEMASLAIDQMRSDTLAQAKAMRDLPFAKRVRAAGDILSGRAFAKATGMASGMQPSAGVHDVKIFQELGPPGVISRIGQALDYTVWGNPQAFFPPGVPLQPQAPDDAMGRKFDYPYFYNVQIQPRAYSSITFQMLRDISRHSYDVMRLVIETCKNQISAQEWAIIPRDPQPKNKTVPAGTQDRIDELKEFFTKPDGQRPFAQWIRMLLEDLLVLDAPALYVEKCQDGTPFALRPVDGATIALKLDYWGDTPRYPEVAYQQVIKGLPALDYTDRDLIYFPYNQATDRAYGYSPVEQILITVNIAARRQNYQLSYFRDGTNTPFLLTAPPDFTPSQLETLNSWYNSQFVDNQRQRFRTVILPYGSKPVSWAESSRHDLKDELDDWFGTVVCYAFGVDKSQLQKMMNRASAQHSGEQSKKEGTGPWMNHLEETITGIIDDFWGYEDVQFRFEPEEENKFTQEVSNAYKVFADLGWITINEGRADLDLEPLPGGDQCVLPMNSQLVQIDEVNKLSDINDQKDEDRELAQQAQAAGIQAKAGGTANVGAGSKPGSAGGSMPPTGSSPKGAGGGGAKPGGKPVRKVSFALDYGEEPEPGETLRFIDKGFDVTPSPVAGMQPFGGQAATLAIPRGHKRHRAGLKKKRKIGRQATVAHRSEDDKRRKRLRETIHNAFRRKAEQTALYITRNRERLAPRSDAGGVTKAAQGVSALGEDGGMAEKAYFHEGGWGESAQPTQQQKSLVAAALRDGWETLPEEIQPILEDAAKETSLGVLTHIGFQEDMFSNETDEFTKELALDRAGELVGMQYDEATDKWIDNPNAVWRIDEDTRDELAGLVATAEEEGWSNEDLSSAIVESHLFSEARADTIARTELKTIDAMAASMVAERTGATSKRWMTGADHEKEDACDENEAKDWIDIDADFPSGDGEPPSHPNCDCVVTYGWEESEEEEDE